MSDGFPESNVAASGEGTSPELEELLSQAAAEKIETARRPARVDGRRLRARIHPSYGSGLSASITLFG